MATREMAKEKWTLVMHSGAGYALDPQFSHAVEPRTLGFKEDGNRMTAKQMEKEVARIEKVGGVIFDTYAEAMEAEEQVNGITGDGPFLSAKGTFSEEQVDGLRIYCPPRKVELA